MNETNQVNEDNQMDEAKRMEEASRRESPGPVEDTARSHESDPQEVPDPSQTAGQAAGSGWMREADRKDDLEQPQEAGWVAESGWIREADRQEVPEQEQIPGQTEVAGPMDAVSQADGADQTSQESVADVTDQSGESKTLKILVAEDEPDIRDLVAFTLRFAGYEVVSGSNGEEAVELARQEHPDLIILDVRMPRMTGYDACKLIKSEPNLKDVPVIFLSAKGQEAEIQSGMDAGAEDYLLKPFAPDQLTDRVRSILAKFGK
jgi:CheY-like chemotaxis protein